MSIQNCFNITACTKYTNDGVNPLLRTSDLLDLRMYSTAVLQICNCEIKQIPHTFTEVYKVSLTIHTYTISQEQNLDKPLKFTLIIIRLHSGDHKSILDQEQGLF